MSFLFHMQIPTESQQNGNIETDPKHMHGNAAIFISSFLLGKNYLPLLSRCLQRTISFSNEH